MHRILSCSPEWQVPDEEVRTRLATRWGRARAYAGLLLGDHHFLRLGFQNAHEIGGGLWRSNQPSPEQLKRWADRGLKTVINLRGMSHSSFHILERNACEQLGLELITLRVFSREPPDKGVPRIAKQMFEEIAYPALIHCKSGADRAGVMAVFYRHFRFGEPFSVAKEQLGLKYLHAAVGKTGILDAYVDAYIEQGEKHGIDLITWSETMFDPKAFRAAYRPGALGDFLVDRVLQRE
jgi:protein tyrosine/serine phosphatase